MLETASGGEPGGSSVLTLENQLENQQIHFEQKICSANSD